LILHELGQEPYSKSPSQNVCQRVSELDLKADHAARIMRIAQLVRRASFGIASPMQDATCQTLAQARIAIAIRVGSLGNDRSAARKQKNHENE
jgi:hypothetical protein